MAEQMWKIKIIPTKDSFGVCHRKIKQMMHQSLGKCIASLGMSEFI
jgi:hypothetical protein